MAHGLVKNKDNMFSVKETPWHGLGKVVHEAPTIEEGIKLAGLDWTVTPETLYRRDRNGELVPVTHRAAVRSDTDDVLGIVGPDWTPLQNLESFKFFDKFLDSGVATLETAGSLKGGEIVWVLAKLAIDPVEIVKEDPIVRYMLLSNGHNGQVAVRTGFTDIRVVCANTLSIAHDSKASRLIRIKHSARVAENVENVKMVIDAANQEFVANMDQLKLLTRKEISQKDVFDFVKITFFKDKPIVTSKGEANFNKMLNRITELVEAGRGVKTKKVKGTVWNLYNAATEYLSHDYGRTPETRLRSLWFGEASRLNQQIFKNAMALATSK